MGLKKEGMLGNARGRQYVFKQNADGEFDCEPCICLIKPYPQELKE